MTLVMMKRTRRRTRNSTRMRRRRRRRKMRRRRRMRKNKKRMTRRKMRRMMKRIGETLLIKRIRRSNEHDMESSDEENYEKEGRGIRKQRKREGRGGG